MKRKNLYAVLICFCALLFLCGTGQASQPVKISIFNFTALNLEASSYGTTVSNVLTGIFRNNPSLSVLDRKDLESFLAMNDLKQNDEPDNVVKIGSRLGLDVIVTGSVKMLGAVIVIDCKAYHVGQRRVIFSKQVSTGDSGLDTEAKALTTALLDQLAKETSVPQDTGKGGTAPPKLEARPGNQSIFLSWEVSQGMKVGGYKVYRSRSEAGPFTTVAQVQKPEFLDQNLEMRSVYFYKVRSYSTTGVQGRYSDVVKVETMPSPNSPIILKAEGLVKSVYLVWSPNPSPSDDPEPLKGYILYRSSSEDGPYRKVKKFESAADFGGSGELAQLTRMEMVHSGLEDSERVFYRISAYNVNGGESELSSPVEAITIPAVKRVNAVGDMIREVHVEWDRAHPSVKGYHLYRSRDEKGEFKRIKTIDASRYEANAPITVKDTDNLGDKTQYFYKVTAFLEPEKETTPSAAASAVTRGKPPVPKGLKAVGGLAKRVELKWAESPEAEVEGYLLYRSDAGKSGQFTLIKKIEGRQNTSYVDGGKSSDFSFRSNNLDDRKTYYYRLETYNKVDVSSEFSEVASAETKARPRSPSGFKAKYEGGYVQISWDPNKELDIVSYIVYEKDGDRLKKIKSVKETTFTEKEKPDGTLKTYMISALDGDELEGDPGREIAVTLK